MWTLGRTSGSLLIRKMRHMGFFRRLLIFTLVLYNLMVLLLVVSWKWPYTQHRTSKLPSYDLHDGHHYKVVNSENVTTSSASRLRHNQQSAFSGNSSGGYGSQPICQNGSKTRLTYGWRDGVTKEAAMNKVAFELMEYKRPVFMDTRAPCFFVEVNESKKDDAKVDRRLSLRCLPSVFLIGAPKSGTTDLYSYLTLHRHVISGTIKEPKFWNANSKKPSYQIKFDQYLKTYAKLAMLTDRCFLRPNESLCKAFQRRGILNPNIWNEVLQLATNGTKFPFITVDASINYMDDAIYWQDDPLNKGSEEVLVYTPHRIKHFVPQAKLVLMFRNPVDRLVSDFYFFIEGLQKLNPDYFHTLVLNGIKWWTSCIRILSESKCAVGVNFTASGVPDLGPGTFSWGDLDDEGDNGVARLRVGLYVLHIEKWLEVFEKENMLVIQMEEYSQNVSRVLERDLLPFLELDTYLEVEWNLIHRQQELMHQNKSRRRKKVVHDETRRLLEEFYRPYNIRLAKLMANERFLWL